MWQARASRYSSNFLVNADYSRQARINGMSWGACAEFLPLPRSLAMKVPWCNMWWQTGLSLQQLPDCYVVVKSCSTQRSMVHATQPEP